MNHLKINLGTMSKGHPRDLIVLVIVVVFLLTFVFRASQFSLLGSLQILAIAMATVGIVSIGQTLVILTGGVDLSVGSLMALTGVVIAYLTTNASITFNPWVAALIGLALATAIGWIHGLLITRFRLAPFIVTFGSLSLLSGLAQVISDGSAINLHTNAFDGLWDNLFGVIPVPALVMALLFIGFAFMLRNTRLGRYTYAIGSNATVARLSGIDVERTQCIIYATSGFLAGIAGLFLLARIEGASFDSGANYELLSIAAVIIGGTSLTGGTGGVWGTLAGVLLMSMVSNGLVLLSIPPLWKEAITGALIIAAALIDVQRRRIQESIPVLERTFAPLPIEPTTPLDESLKHLTDSLQERFGFEASRVYLRDRASGELVEPRDHSTPGGTLALKAYTSAKPLWVNDLRREQEFEVVAWEARTRAAAAVPIQHHKRVIGSIEVQSSNVNLFNAQALDAFAALAGQVAENLEDRWLLESGWLTHQLRESLRNLRDDVYLNHCALAEWLQIHDLTTRSNLLRQILYDAIEHTLPEVSDSRTTRRYQILKQTYLDQLPVEAICQNLSLSRRQYFYDLKQAVDVMVDFLYTQRHQISLRYDAPPIAQ
ncbi:MAG TPA: GAF domain-containing protein [Phototrophicaceae bacterium]|nr:GAF domain-containing protein [Phototrophicaceae bacterium]